MASLTLASGNKDYFKELHLKRQQRAQNVEAGAGSSTPAVEAAIPINVVSEQDTSRPHSTPARLRSQLEEFVVKLQLALEENNSLSAKNKDLEANINHWKSLCAEAERTGREVAENANEEIRGLKESLSDMALTNYQSEEKIKMLLKDLKIVENNVIDQHELG